MAAYLGEELPPVELITSVRSIVLRGDEVLVLRNRDSTHFLPGGRRELRETLEQTLRREIAEETGWTIATPRLLGFLYLRHLSPLPPDYPYAYPDFFQVMDWSEAEAFVASARLADDYEIECGFRPIAEVRALRPPEAPFLDAALRQRNRGLENDEGRPILLWKIGRPSSWHYLRSARSNEPVGP